MDLEGRLSIGGSINLIQVACDSKVYIFDVFQLRVLDKNEQLLQLVATVLKCVFLNPDIRKVFFDGKKDMEALHFILGVGTANVFDA